nr:immunoglobulin light chain junction region [Macaca mulatta]MOV98928.1 immunoglobulin light chain junction region [Macaca mulatta]
DYYCSSYTARGTFVF